MCKCIFLNDCVLYVTKFSIHFNSYYLAELTKIISLKLNGRINIVLKILSNKMLCLLLTPYSTAPKREPISTNVVFVKSGINLGRTVLKIYFICMTDIECDSNAEI